MKKRIWKKIWWGGSRQYPQFLNLSQSQLDSLDQAVENMKKGRVSEIKL